MCILSAWYGGKGFGMVEGLCQELTEEVQFLNDKQEIWIALKGRSDCRAKLPKNFTKAKTVREAVILRKKKHQLNVPECKGQSKNDAEDRRIEDGMARGPYSFAGSGPSSRREVDDVASEISWTAVGQSKAKGRWSLEPEVKWRSRRPGLIMAGRKVDPRILKAKGTIAPVGGQGGVTLCVNTSTASTLKITSGGWPPEKNCNLWCAICGDLFW